MQIMPIKSRLVGVGDDIVDIFADTGQKLEPGDVLVVASKIVSYATNRLAAAAELESLSRSEADVFVDGEVEIGRASCRERV